MSGLRIFFAKELQEVVRTWRVWVLPGIVLFVALLSAPQARVTPQLIKSLTASQPGVIINIPEPVALDAYRQFGQNLNQFALLALIIVAAGSVSGERRNGTATLVLTKPLSRGAFIVAKLAAQTLVLALVTVVGTCVCWGVTRLIFGAAPIAPLARGVGCWLVLAAFFVALSLLCSVLIAAPAGAAGVGIGLWLLLSIFASWAPARAASPAGVFAASNRLGELEGYSRVWPIVATLVLALLCIGATVMLFGLQELTRRGDE
jgi:ABC-2 type transport system permease protein